MSPLPSPLVLAALYVPGDRAERFVKAAASGADTVVIDLEDSVVEDHKDDARRNALDWLTRGPHQVRTEVRVNSDPRRAADDLRALRDAPGLAAVRLPKVESARQVRDAAALLQPRAGTGVTALIESARGVEAAHLIATADPAVTSVALGEADLASDLGVTEDRALDWARSRVVVAARAAGLPAPLMSVFPDIRDLDALARSCRRGRALGFFGRSAIHPRQVPVIVEAFAPTPQECSWASEVLAVLRDAAASGRGAATLVDGSMVDPAMTGRAAAILARAALADRARAARSGASHPLL